MKILKARPELCCECGSCMDICSLTLFKHVDREKAAIRVAENSGAGMTITVCNQCGECIDICPVKAIEKAKTGTVRIKKDLCVGCLACVGFCPNASMFFNKDIPHPIKCLVCGACVKECPVQALSIEEA